jgi:hypothetical protein
MWSSNGSGAVTELAVGAANTVLRGTGTGSAPAFGALTKGDLPAGTQVSWTALVKDTDFNDQAPSAYTITMATDQTANIKAGQPVKIICNSATKYCLVTAMASNLMTLSGPPLTTTDGHITVISYGTTDMTEEVDLFISGAYGDGTGTTQLASDMKTYFTWRKGPAYLAYVAATHGTAAGTTQPKMNVRLGAGADQVITAASSIQLSTAGTWVSTAGAGIIDAAKYDLVFGDKVELECYAAGNPTGGATDLTMQLVFVKEN